MKKTISVLNQINNMMFMIPRIIYVENQSIKQVVKTFHDYPTNLLTRLEKAAEINKNVNLKIDKFDPCLTPLYLRLHLQLANMKQVY